MRQSYVIKIRHNTIYMVVAYYKFSRKMVAAFYIITEDIVEKLLYCTHVFRLKLECAILSRLTLG
jgi:hypothetical protein